MKKYNLSKSTYEELANFRYQLRKYLRFIESEARSVGITPHQYQLALAIRGFPGRDYATPSELAERLQITQHACVELINRCEHIGLVYRMPNPEDRRSVYVGVTDHGEEIMEKVSEIHLKELEHIGLFKTT